MPLLGAAGKLREAAQRRRLLKAEARALSQARETTEAGVRSAAVRLELSRCYWALKRSHTPTRSPWIDACIEAIDKGEECPKETAILALERTLGEIGGERSAAPIYEALDALERME